jgi:hypothetical protein
MKKILGLSVLAVAMTVGASANTLTEVETCGPFQDTLSNSIDSTLGVVSGYPEYVVCAAPSTFLTGGETFTSVQAIFNQGFTSGALTGPNTITGTFTVFAGGSGLDSDTLVTSAPSGDSPETTTDTYENTYVNAQNFIDGGDSTTNAAFTIEVSESLTAGTIQSATGNIYELITYTTAAPEPMTLSLVGAGLIGLGFVRRRASK